MAALSCAAQQGSGPPLPPIHELLQKAAAIDLWAKQHKSDYEYIQVSGQQFEANGKANTDPDNVKVRLCYRIQGVAVCRLVWKNGAPLDAAEQASTDRDVKKVVQDGLKRRAAVGGSQPSDVLLFEKLGSFLNERRTMRNARSTILVEYVGDPKRKASGINERTVRNLRGTLAFDEKDGAIAFSDFTLQTDMSYLLVAGVKKGFRTVDEAVNVSPGVWLPASSLVAGHAKLFFNTVDGDTQEHYYGYRLAESHPKDIYAGVPINRMDADQQRALSRAIVTTAPQQEDAEENFPADKPAVAVPEP